MVDVDPRIQLAHGCIVEQRGQRLEVRFQLRVSIQINLTHHGRGVTMPLWCWPKKSWWSWVLSLRGAVVTCSAAAKVARVLEVFFVFLLMVHFLCV